jgi:hypothetical protein
MERLDLNAISHVTAMRQGWSEETRLRILREYREFLDDASRRRGSPGEPACPTHEVDELWHMHMLNSETYFEDCRRWFGSYIHHRPIPKAPETALLRDLGLMPAGAGDDQTAASDCSSQKEQPPPKDCTGYSAQSADCSSPEQPDRPPCTGSIAHRRFADCSSRGPVRPPSSPR